MSAPSAPDGGYAPTAPYAPMYDKPGGEYSPSYTPAGPHQGGMGYQPGPGQSSYPPGRPMESYQSISPNYPDLNEPVSKQPAPSGIQHQEQQQPLLQARPVGLQYLLGTETIRFKQVVHVAQIVCACDMPIEFDLINENDQIIYQLQETENICLRNCVPQGYRTNSVVSTTNNATVIRFKREARCVFNCCLPCCCFKLPFSRERLSVFGDFEDRLLGVVQHDFGMSRSRFSILDADGNAVLRIEGPEWNFGCFSDLIFQIVSPDGVPVGSIVKHYGGVIRETCSDFDNFTIKFPRDMDVGTKGTLLGAVSLINFLFFQGAIRRFIRDAALLGAAQAHPITA